ncbi:DNA-binding response regulator, OmpR family, contains REC and winged-helix (wHTH) domain [Clostridium collagenovorans DSM 3089]|uniref:Stage 0 sporulation protein A homolog n=1 Tax=Clostridium collagenovorans DSM 3089 TaxID=1121306 RepID=A0A1M5WSL8_9CLOT|nr:response regulator transcription factor [Clostridium collagenovorans]SHH90625.1 DNA-binding response regulator, OmpR family, contains REC and winged-helix (wHTH) domain [Clostridium collagenovorans DSM 3089]
MYKVLLVEDDETLALALTYTLESNGYKVVSSYNLSDGKQKFMIDNYDLIILDVTLPDGTGYDLCKFIRVEDLEIPIIFLTACDEEVNVVLGLDIGGDDYITKPFRINELLSRIKAILRRKSVDKCKSKEVTERIYSNNIFIDKSKMKLYKDGEELSVSAQEYRLMLLFMENQERILTREQILARLWDDKGDYVEDNTLSVYIKRLRQKIEMDSSNPKIIETVRGVGYRFRGNK